MKEILSQPHEILPRITRMKVISAPMVGRELNLSLENAQNVLVRLEDEGLIHKTTQGSLVPIYEITKQGYSTAETVRERPFHFLRGFFEHLKA